MVAAEVVGWYIFALFDSYEVGVFHRVPIGDVSR